jgi:hypothetical protein
MSGVDRRVREAVARDALAALLLGRDGLAFVNPWFDTPTDPLAVFAAYRAAFGAEPRAMQRFADALVTASAAADDGWVTAYYVPELFDHAALFGADFDARACAAVILARIREARAHLTQVRRWAGAGEPEGCWGVVDRYVRGLRAERPDELGDVAW